MISPAFIAFKKLVEYAEPVQDQAAEPAAKAKFSVSEFIRQQPGVHPNTYEISRSDDKEHIFVRNRHNSRILVLGRTEKVETVKQKIQQFV